MGGPAAPEVRVVGRGVVGPSSAWTSTAGRTSAATTLADFSDTATNLVLRERIGEASAARFAVGALAPTPDVGDVFVHRLYGTLRHRWLQVIAGRIRLPTRQIMLPTFRDDDLLAHTDLPNPFVAQQSTQSTHYGSLASLRVGPFDGVSAWIYAEQLARDASVPSAPPARIADRLGADVVLEREEHGTGADVDHVALGTRWTMMPDGQGRASLLASAVVHGSVAAHHFLEVRVHGFYADGSARAPVSTRAPDLASAAALRYLHRPERSPRLQLAAVAATRRSLWMGGGSHFAMLANALYRVGPAIDLGIQAQRDRWSGSLATLGADERLMVQLAMMVSFDVALFGKVDEPSSLLDLEHAHIP